MKAIKQGTTDSPEPKMGADAKVWAFRLLAILLVVVLAEAAAIAVLWHRNRAVRGAYNQVRMFMPEGNPIKRLYPQVDFTRIYVGHTAEEIELIQTDPFRLAYVYEPHTGFTVAPAKRKTVEVTGAGFRAGADVQPWPPDSKAINVFVFGGSTTFGYSVRNGDTLPAAMQEEFRRAARDRRVECYNFGCGYYISTQERLRFEMLLAAGHRPDVAVFLDGLNDFYYYDGKPEFTLLMERCFEPNKPQDPPPPSTPEHIVATVDRILARYQANARMISAVAERWQVQAILVGQPIPFGEFPLTAQTYPFPLPVGEHGLAMIAYGRFQEQGRLGNFGTNFLWAADAFAGARTPMYADAIHYSPEGNRVLARVIIERARARGLLPY